MKCGTMSTSTERQLVADGLHQAFLVDFIAELEAHELASESRSSRTRRSSRAGIGGSGTAGDEGFFEFEIRLPPISRHMPARLHSK